MFKQTSDPYISVIVACFNQATELQICLRSFLAQDYPKERYEIIVIDDASENADSMCVVGQARRDYPTGQIHGFRQHRRSAGIYGSSAQVKNAGIRLAKGEIISRAE